MGKLLKAQQFIEAIQGTGGIKTTIAARVGCSWHTVDKWCRMVPSVKAAYEDECERMLDVAESVVLQALRDELKSRIEVRKKNGAVETRMVARPLDPSMRLQMVRYYLSTKGKHRGYTEKQELGMTDAAGKPIPIREIIVKVGETGDEPAGKQGAA